MPSLLPTDHPEVWSAARAAIEQHGADAVSYAQRRMCAASEAGDPAEIIRWAAIEMCVAEMVGDSQ